MLRMKCLKFTLSAKKIVDFLNRERNSDCSSRTFSVQNLAEQVSSKVGRKELNALSRQMYIDEQRELSKDKTCEQSNAW